MTLLPVVTDSLPEGEKETLAAILTELQGLKFTVVAGAAINTNIGVAGIVLAEDTLVSVLRLNRDATAANVDLLDVSAESAITSDGNIRLTTTDTTGDKLLVIWFNKK